MFVTQSRVSTRRSRVAPQAVATVRSWVSPSAWGARLNQSRRPCQRLGIDHRSSQVLPSHNVGPYPTFLGQHGNNGVLERRA